MEITAETTMGAWRNAVKRIIAEGRRFVDDDGKACRELRNLVVTVERPSSAAEGVRAMRVVRKWRYPSEEELTAIMLNREATGIYDYLYGRRIFAYRGIFNQVDGYVVPLLQQKPTTRKALVCLLDPVTDLKVEQQNVLGMSLIHFQIVGKKLVLTAIIRTSGFFAGWPANIFQLARLQEHVAHALHVPPGPLTTISLAAHIHDENLEDIGLVLGSDVVGE